MKKKYQLPTTKWLEAHIEGIMNTSIFTENPDGSLEQDLSDANTTTETFGNLSRQSLWNEE